jgi:hypothetical protein
MRRTYTTLCEASFELMEVSRDHSSHVLLPSAVQRIAMTSLLIRAADGSDGYALQRLAVLDSAHVPAGELLVAEADGALVAAQGDDAGARERRGVDDELRLALGEQGERVGDDPAGLRHDVELGS